MSDNREPYLVVGDAGGAPEAGVAQHGSAHLLREQRRRREAPVGRARRTSGPDAAQPIREPRRAVRVWREQGERVRPSLLLEAFCVVFLHQVNG